MPTSCKTKIDTHRETITSSGYLSARKATSQESSAKQEESGPAGKEASQPADDFTFTADEKFGLLSAFLDDEVSEEERCLVNHWLKSDADLQATYQQQLRLRAALKHL